MIQAVQYLKNIRKKWLLVKTVEVLVLAFGFGVFSYFLSLNYWLSAGIFFTFIGISFFLVNPRRYDLHKVCSHVDATVPKLQYSASLLLTPVEELSVLGRIQQQRISDELYLQKSNIKFNNRILAKSGIALVLVLFGFVLRYSGVLNSSITTENNTPKNQMIQFQPLDSVTIESNPPSISNQEVVVSYPAYTNKREYTTSKMDLKVLEGSRVHWNIQFDMPIKSAVLQFGDEKQQMVLKNKTYSKSLLADYAKIYNLKFIDVQGHSYLSDLYALEIIKDEPPVIEVKGLPQFSTFNVGQEQILEFDTTITDDFGIADMYIVATVSKGSGESVKFREEKLDFDTKASKGATKMLLKKRLNLRSLKMEAGDELYFYIEAKDYKEPKANIGRTETYFSVIKDTVSNGFAVEGTLGADLMPDYFRSQRQLIIDTEKLLANKSILKEQEFNFTSNELGFDQKALRLKYGKFMGDESEGAFSSETDDSVVEDENDEDPLDEFTHAHDSDNEHNLVDHEHGHEEDEKNEKDEDPLEEYLHNHEDPEASTLFAKSLKSKLKQAMTEMWDAELYLRLYEPEKSLPYQYKALKLIQEIKNSARIYVHRIGFDPPPIKESKRLSGKIDEVKNNSKEAILNTEDQYVNMRKAISRIALLLNNRDQIQTSDKILFENAGNELGVLAIQEPSKHLRTLQDLKWLSQTNVATTKDLQRVQKGLIESTPAKQTSPNLKNSFVDKLDELLLQELTKNE